MKYTVIVLYKGKHYVHRKWNSDQRFSLPRIEVQFPGKTHSKEKLRQEIAETLQKETAFRNTKYTGSLAYKAVSLIEGKYSHTTHVAVFECNYIDRQSSHTNIPFCDSIEEQCDKETIQILKKLKRQRIWPAVAVNIIYAIVFALCAYTVTEENTLWNVVPFLYALLDYTLLIVRRVFSHRPLIIRHKLLQYTHYLLAAFFREILLLLFAAIIGRVLMDVGIMYIPPDFGLCFLFIDAAIRIIQTE